MALLLGFKVCGSIALTPDEFRGIQKLYRFTPEGPNKKPEPPVAPKPEDFDVEWKYKDALRAHKIALQRHENWEDPQALMQAGADRNALRHAEADGLRLLAWIAQYVPAGEDPLKHLIQMAIEADLVVDPADRDWAWSDSP